MGYRHLVLQTPVVNSSPTDITLTRNYVRVDAGLNAVLGVLDAVDVDTGDTHTFTLVAGTGDTNNASFNISGSNLRCDDPATLGIGTYSVRIQADDGTSTPFSKALTVEVLDVAKALKCTVFHFQARLA